MKNLSRTEASVYGRLVEERKEFTVTALADALGMKKGNLSGYLKRLHARRLVSIVPAGGAKNVSAPYPDAVEYAKTEYPGVRPSDILAGKMPYLLAYLRNKKMPFGTRGIDLPAITAKRLLKKLRALGIVYSEARGRYVLKTDAHPLIGFCSSILERMHTAEAERELGGITRAIFSYDSAQGLEAVFVTDRENSPRHYWPTAYTVFNRHGIRLVLAGKYYYTDVKPGIADAALHCLAVGRDARSIMYVAALMLKNKIGPDSLLGKRQRFGIPEGFLRGLVRFVESRGKESAEGFPSWEEVEEVAHGKAV